MISSVIAFMGGKAMRFVNEPAAPPPPPPPPVPVADPDGELVRLCEEFCEAEVRRYTEAPPDDAPATFDQGAFDDLMDTVDEQQKGLFEQIARHPPTTLDGARAVARAYRAYVLDDCFNPLTMAIDGQPADASEPPFEDKLLCVLLSALGHDPELDCRINPYRRGSR